MNVDKQRSVLWAAIRHRGTGFHDESIVCRNAQVYDIWTTSNYYFINAVVYYFMLCLYSSYVCDKIIYIYIYIPPFDTTPTSVPIYYTNTRKST